MTTQITLPREVVERACEYLLSIEYHMMTTHGNKVWDAHRLTSRELSAALTEQVQQPKITGWPPGLLQDDCRGLASWLSSRPDALYKLRELYAEQVQPAQGELPSLPSPVELNPASNSVMGYHEAHLKEYARAALLQSNAERVPLSEARIESIYMLASVQSLRPQDKAIVIKFARAIEAEITKGQQ